MFWNKTDFLLLKDEGEGGKCYWWLLQDLDVQLMSFTSQHLWGRGTSPPAEVSRAVRCMAISSTVREQDEEGRAGLDAWKLSEWRQPKQCCHHREEERELETSLQGPLKLLRKEETSPSWKAVTWDISRRRKQQDIFHKISDCQDNKQHNPCTGFGKHLGGLCCPSGFQPAFTLVPGKYLEWGLVPDIYLRISIYKNVFLEPLSQTVAQSSSLLWLIKGNSNRTAITGPADTAFTPCPSWLFTPLSSSYSLPPSGMPGLLQGLWEREQGGSSTGTMDAECSRELSGKTRMGQPRARVQAWCDPWRSEGARRQEGGQMAVVGWEQVQGIGLTADKGVGW